MDISPSIFYGFYLGDIDDNPWDTDDKPHRVYPEDFLNEKLGDEAAPIDIHFIGHSEYPHYYLIVTESLISSYSWDAVEITLKDLKWKSEWDIILKQYAERLGLEHKSPNWHMGAYLCY